MLRSKLRLHKLWVGSFFVDLVNRNDNFSVGCFGKPNRLDCLWLHAVIGSNHNNYHIGKCCAVLAKRRKGFVARRIKKRNRTVFSDCLIGANVLSDTTCFAVNNLLAKDGIKKAGLTMVDMTHNGHDRRAIHCLI
ncbi:hypothetical protein D9M69_665030 [compost metagenome]